MVEEKREIDVGAESGGQVSLERRQPQNSRRNCAPYVGNKSLLSDICDLPSASSRGDVILGALASSDGNQVQVATAIAITEKGSSLIQNSVARQALLSCWHDQDDMWNHKQTAGEMAATERMYDICTGARVSSSHL